MIVNLKEQHCENFLQSLHKEQWQEVRLGEVAEINPKETLRKHYLYKKVAMDNLEPYTKKVYSFGIESFNGGAKFRNGDTLLARITPCLENGKTAFVDFLQDDEIAFGSTEFIVLREKTTISDKDFLYYLARSKHFREVAIKSMTGSSGRERVQIEVLRDFTFLLPPLTTQQKIAEILSSFDDKIDLLHRQNKTLESLALTLFRHYFIDNPKRDEWELGKLGEEFDFVMGVSPKGSSYNEQQRGVPMFQGNADFGFRFPTNRIYTDEPRKFAEKFDTLVSVRAPVGAVNIAQEKCCIGRGLSAFRHKHKDLHSYTFYKMKFLSKEFERFNDKGTIFGAISKGDFENIDIWIPPLEYGVRINQELKTIDDKIYNNAKQIQNLQAMRDMLLKAIFE